MKKSILIIAISAILFGCKSSNNNSDNSGEEIAVVKKNDTKSNKISELINSLENKDLSVANTLFDDSIIINIRFQIIYIIICIIIYDFIIEI